MSTIHNLNRLVAVCSTRGSVVIRQESEDFFCIVLVRNHKVVFKAGGTSLNSLISQAIDFVKHTCL